MEGNLCAEVKCGDTGEQGQGKEGRQLWESLVHSSRPEAFWETRTTKTGNREETTTQNLGQQWATGGVATDLAEPRRLNHKLTWRKLRINTKIKGTEINSTGAQRVEGKGGKTGWICCKWFKKQLEPELPSLTLCPQVTVLPSLEKTRGLFFREGNTGSVWTKGQQNQLKARIP